MDRKFTELFNALVKLDLQKLAQEDKEDLLALFSHTKNHPLRNLLAKHLAELVYEPAVPVIFDKILDNANYNNTGSLVFALESFDLKNYLKDLVQILLSPHSFESMMTVHYVIEKSQHSFGTLEKENARATLLAYRSSEPVWDLDNDIHYYIDEVIDLLDR